MQTASGRPLLERGWRYTLVGLVCVMANYAIMLAVDFGGGHYLLGTTIAFSVVAPIGYVLHSRFTFSEPLKLKVFLRFVGAVASTYPVAVAMMILLCSGLQLTVAIATPITTVALFVWNFVATHWAILPRFNLSPAIAVEHRPAGNDEWQR
jgi:putative flippase GtrA